MNCVGIDVSKGKSMIAVMRPFGEVVYSPFEVLHTSSELSALAKRLKSLDGETRVVMEATGNYHLPIAVALHEAGIYVSVVNAMLVHNYGNNTLRRAKTDKKDAIKLANYGLDRWLTLPKFTPEDKNRMLLKTCYRQYRQYSQIQTMLKNNLISLLDTVFPGVNHCFPALRKQMEVKNGWISLKLSGIVNASVDYPRKLLKRNTRNGAKSTTTTSQKVRYLISIPLPASVSV